MKKYIKNLQLNTEPNTTLFEQEAQALIAIVVNVLEVGNDLPKTGTFLLYGVADDKPKDLQKIVSFNFKGGTLHNCIDSGYTSDQIGDSVLRLAATQLSKSESKTAITYYVDSPAFLKLKTTHGTFLCFFWGDNGSSTYVYCASAKAIAMMGKEDQVLQESCKYLFFTEMEDYPSIDMLDKYVEHLFEQCNLDELEEWKKWHEPANGSGELTLFFQ